MLKERETRKVPTFQGRVEAKATDADYEVAEVTENEDDVMAFLNTVQNTTVRVICEQEICERIDDLSNVYRRVIILQKPAISDGSGQTAA